MNFPMVAAADGKGQCAMLPPGIKSELRLHIRQFTERVIERDMYFTTQKADRYINDLKKYILKRLQNKAQACALRCGGCPCGGF